MAALLVCNPGDAAETVARSRYGVGPNVDLVHKTRPAKPDIRSHSNSRLPLVRQISFPELSPDDGCFHAKDR